MNWKMVSSNSEQLTIPLSEHKHVNVVMEVGNYGKGARFWSALRIDSDAPVAIISIAYKDGFLTLDEAKQSVLKSAHALADTIRGVA